MYSKLCEEHNITKVAESLYIFLTTPDEVKKCGKMMQSNSFDSDSSMQLEDISTFCPQGYFWACQY